MSAVTCFSKLMLSQVNERFVGKKENMGRRKTCIYVLSGISFSVSVERGSRTGAKLIGADLILLLLARIAEVMGEEWRRGKLVIHTLETHIHKECSSRTRVNLSLTSTPL